MDNFKNLWGPLRVLLRGMCTSYRIVQVISTTGISLQEILTLPLTSKTDDKNRLMEAIDKEFFALSEEEAKRFLQITAEEIINPCPHLEPVLINYLERLGWTMHEGSLVPIEVLDISDLPELPEESRQDLVNATIRFRNGNLSGAITSSCGAVNSATETVYKNMSLGDPGKASFQEKVKKSITAKRIFDDVENDLISIGWTPSDSGLLIQNLRGSINQAAYVMQSLRSKMGDTHGTKPTLKPLVFDTLKWASLIVRLLK